MTGHRIVIILASVVGLAVVIAWGTVSIDPMARMRSAADRGDWRSVVSMGDSLKSVGDPARLLRARALRQLGRLDEAADVYSRIDPAAMNAADDIELATFLERRGRPALAWLALDAAGKIDPGRSDTRDALTALEGRIGTRGTIAHVTERLGAISDGLALRTLVLGLAALAKSDATDDPILDRVLARDRATLRQIDSAPSARRLLSRILLEVGRATEARRWLTLILASGPDREASWLLSRACLQMGDESAAEKALDQAGDFGRDRPHLAEPTVYVGARACRECHSSIYDAQQQSRHATTITHGPDVAKIPLPNGTVVDPVDPSVSHTFTRIGDKVRIETKTKDASYRALMDYALGSGHRGMTLVGKDESGAYREARISLYSEHGTSWDVTSGFSPHPGDPGEYLGKVLSPSGFRDCIHCHVTRFRSIADRSGPEAADRGIGCERCHGPGGNHVAAMRTGFADLAIGRFKGATGPQRMTACSSCHASDGTFPPTDPQFVRFQATTLPFSKCYTASNGKLDCVTCHDPHKPLETSPAFYESKCLNCHGPKSGEAPDGFRRVSCPINATSDCLKCHMPRIEEVAPHTSFTDHHIRARRPGGEPSK